LLTNQTSKDDILQILGEISDKKLNDNDENLDDNNENNLIINILNLNKKNVEDVMVPRAEIIAIEKNKSMKNILSLIKVESHSRMPVYEQNLDNIQGFVHIKDVIKSVDNSYFEIKKILRDVLYVAPKSPILELLKRMRSSRIHMGLIVDEFGGVDGLVTIEDLVEEIVGEIEDEHDDSDDNLKFQKINATKIIVDASYKLIDLENYFDIQIKENLEEEIDSLGGLVFFIAGKIPKNGEIYRYKDLLKFKIISASDRRIFSLEIDKL
jgi:CBS domain containing-hemolysin-like protein